MTKINLFISLYPIDDFSRVSEIIYCLERNLTNPFISRIFILNEGFKHSSLDNNKVVLINFNKRPMYSDFFAHMIDEELNIISNNDIYFDNSLKELKKLRFHKQLIYIITRREKSGELFNTTGNSHDSWVFLGKPIALKYCNYFLGIPKCEQRMAAIFNDFGYYVLNPSKFINSFHVHNSSERAYLLTGEVYNGCGLLVKPVGRLEIRILYFIFWYLRRKKYFFRRYYENGEVVKPT